MFKKKALATISFHLSQGDLKQAQAVAADYNIPLQEEHITIFSGMHDIAMFRKDSYAEDYFDYKHPDVAALEEEGKWEEAAELEDELYGWDGFASNQEAMVYMIMNGGWDFSTC